MYRRLTFAFLAMAFVALFFPQPGTAAPSADKVNIAVKNEVFSLDATYDSYGYNGLVLQNLYEFLIDKDAKGRAAPGLASSWTISPDGKIIDFMLRKDVKFHSGDHFTAKDVVFTIERCQKVDPGMKRRLKPLVKVEAVDDYHVRFVFKSVDVTFIPNRLGVMIVSKDYFDRVGEKQFMKKPVGTAPYKFVHYQPGSYIDLERFEDYWGKKPQVKAARIYFVKEDTTRVAKLQTGEVDFIQGTPYSLVKTVENDPNLKIFKHYTNSPNRGIAFANQNPKVPWYDRRVRQAFAHAVDADTIIKTVLFGLPGRGPWIGKNDLGYNPEIDLYPFDPEKAKKLLAEAGYPNGFDFEFFYRIGGRVPMQTETVQAIANYLRNVGIRAKVVALENEAMVTKRRAAKKADAVYVAYDVGSLAGNPDPVYASNSRFRCGGSSSPYCNPEFDKLNDKAVQTMDDAKRGELIKQMVKIMHDDVASVPIFDNVAIFSMHKNIDFVPLQDRFDVAYVKGITVK